MFQSPMRSARASSSVEKYSFRYGSAPPCSRSSACRNRGRSPRASRSAGLRPLRRISSPRSIFLGRGAELRRATVRRRPRRARDCCPRNRKFLVPYFSWISFSFGRLSPIVRDVEVAGLDQHFDRLDHRRLERRASCTGRPTAPCSSKYGGVLRELDHRVGHRLVGDRRRSSARCPWRRARRGRPR